jgi:hypothetical protein
MEMRCVSMYGHDKCGGAGAIHRSAVRYVGVVRAGLQSRKDAEQAPERRAAFRGHFVGA